MAKKTTKKAPQTELNTDVPETALTIDAEFSKEGGEEIDAFEAGLAAAEQLLGKVTKAKATDFVTKESDFWKPREKGEMLQGVYLGSVKRPRYLVHAIAVVGKDGKAMIKRINGTRILSKELQRGEKNQGVRVVFDGEGKTDEGQKLMHYTVSWL